jgi:hypothetical protein
MLFSEQVTLLVRLPAFLYYSVQNDLYINHYAIKINLTCEKMDCIMVYK